MSMSSPAGASSDAAPMPVGARHPSPHRHRVTPRALWFGLYGAPAAWSVQVLVGFAMSAHGCYPRAIPLASPVIGVRAIALLVTAVAAGLAIAAGVTALVSWRTTREEMDGREEALLEIGDGRTRFMALSGVLVSILFLLAIGLSYLSIAVVPPCTYGA